MLGLSYGELFLILGATAALIGPKDLPKIAKVAGRLAGRAIGYVQMARGQFDNVMQQSQANQVHKELQDTLAQLEAIRYEIRSISIINPTPFTRRLDGATEPDPGTKGNANGYSDHGTNVNEMGDGQINPAMNIPKGFSSADTVSSRLYSQATAYARLAEAPSVKSSLAKNSIGAVKLDDERDGLLTVLPVSAESAGFIPKRSGEPTGSDILLEAILEAEVARNAKQFFSQPENQIPPEIPKE